MKKTTAKKGLSKLLFLILTLSVTGAAMPVTGCSESVENQALYARKTSLPSGDFQIDVSFPDCAGASTLSALPANSQKSFTMYTGQGTAYVTVAENVESFDLLFNNVPVETDSMTEAGTYEIDFSGVSVNGRNMLQVLNILPNDISDAVNVKIGYPIVIAGSAEECGIHPTVLDAMECIINADIDNGFTSAQISIIKDGKEIYSNAFGKVNSYNQDGTVKEDSALVTTGVMYDLASNTKMYATNYAVQKLVTEGKLDISTKLIDIFGSEFADSIIDINYDGYENPGLEVNKVWKSNLTIADILHHQAGFPADPQYFNENFNQETQKSDTNTYNVLFSSNSADADAKEKTLESIFKTPLMYEPGTKAVYSDVDYMLLGLIVEKITGMSLDQYCIETFYEPLGLTHTLYNPLQNGYAPEDCAATELNGNTRDGAISFTNVRTETIQGQVHDEKAYYCMGGVSGHAGLFSTASELSKLASVMLSGGYGYNKFFSRDVIDNFTAPASMSTTNYGLGWWREGDGKRVSYFGTAASSDTIGHQGWTGTLTMIDPSQNLIVVILTNKINSPVTDKETNPNKFDGNYYTTASLGFLPQMLSLGIGAAGDENVKTSMMLLMEDMVSESLRLLDSYQLDTADITPEHPAVRNIYAKAEACVTYAKMLNTVDAKEAAEKAVGLLDSQRDEEEIVKLKQMLCIE